MNVHDRSSPALANRLHRQRHGRSTLEACRSDVDMALSLVADPGPHLILAVRIAGERFPRPTPDFADETEGRTNIRVREG